MNLIDTSNQSPSSSLDSSALKEFALPKIPAQRWSRPFTAPRATTIAAFLLQQTLEEVEGHAFQEAAQPLKDLYGYSKRERPEFHAEGCKAIIALHQYIESLQKQHESERAEARLSGSGFSSVKTGARISDQEFLRRLDIMRDFATNAFYPTPDSKVHGQATGIVFYGSFLRGRIPECSRAEQDVDVYLFTHGAERDRGASFYAHVNLNSAEHLERNSNHAYRYSHTECTYPFVGSSPLAQRFADPHQINMLKAGPFLVMLPGSERGSFKVFFSSYSDSRIFGTIRDL